MHNIFAKDRHKDQERERREAAEEFSDRRRSLTKLVNDPDFRSFYQYLAYEFCGSDFGTSPVSAETQGIRMAMAKINETISIAEGGPDLIGQVAVIHFKAMGESIARERTKKIGEN